MTIDETLNLLPDFNYGSRFISLDEAVGKRVATDIFAVKNLPSFDNSAMDGYAINYADKNEPLRVADTILAGQTEDKILEKGSCVKIMTGAKIPQNADTVVPFEDAVIENEKLIVSKNIKKFNAYRYKGEEIKAGEILIKKGSKLSASYVMLLASQGIYCVEIFKEPIIKICSSGDEVVEPWQNESEDKIYNANASGIAALLSEFGFKSDYGGIIKDDLQTTKNKLNSDDYDILICSGGASAGEADYMKSALLSLGFKEIFNRLDMRPGRPTKAYVRDKKVVFILPGNPMAAFVTAFLLVVPFLKKKPHCKIAANINQDLKFKTGRQNLVLGTLKGGDFIVTDGNKYGSGMITPLTKSDALYLTDIEECEILGGSEILVYKFS